MLARSQAVLASPRLSASDDHDCVLSRNGEDPLVPATESCERALDCCGMSCRR